MKSKIFAHSQRPRARANDHDAMVNISRCTTVNMQSVHTLNANFNESVHTVYCAHTLRVYTHGVYRKFDEFSMVSPCTDAAAASFEARKQRILEFQSFKLIRQTVCTQLPAYMSYVELTNHPKLANHPAKKNRHFSHAPGQQKIGKKSADVQLRRTLCTHSVQL